MVSRQFLRRKTLQMGTFFCFLRNTLAISNGPTLVLRDLPTTIFFYTNLWGHNYRTSVILKIVNSGRCFWQIFWQFVSYSEINRVGFFAELELIGLGYRIRKITSKVYRFFWGYANYVYLFIPKDTLIEYDVDDRYVFFFSFNSFSINNLVTYLMLLKKISPYRVTGFIKPGKIIRLNSGKQR